jgi:hypothetical protein
MNATHIAKKRHVISSRKMNVVQWYAVSIAAVTGIIFMRRVGGMISSPLITRLQFVFNKQIAYPLIKRWYLPRMTRLQATFLGSYFIINGFCMGLGIRTGDHFSHDLMVRSGTMAAANLVPLFLGGRTNTLANFMGISLHTYYLAHHWIGRVVVVQSIIHVAFSIAAGTPWTFNSSQISGITVSGKSGPLPAIEL